MTRDKRQATGGEMTRDARQATGDDMRHATRTACRNAEMSPRVTHGACRVSNPGGASRRAGDDLYVAKTIRTYTIVQPKDLVVNGLNLNFDLLSMRIAQVEENGVITSAYIVMRPIATDRAFPDYMKYLLKAYDFQKVFHNMGHGVRKSLSFSELAKLNVPLPTLPEQREIAEYLDHAVSRIDAVIARRKAQLEKLESFKRSMIQEYVTGRIAVATGSFGVSEIDSTDSQTPRLPAAKAIKQEAK